MPLSITARHGRGRALRRVHTLQATASWARQTLPFRRGGMPRRQVANRLQVSSMLIRYFVQYRRSGVDRGHGNLRNQRRNRTRPTGASCSCRDRACEARLGLAFISCPAAGTPLLVSHVAHAQAAVHTARRDQLPHQRSRRQLLLGLHSERHTVPGDVTASALGASVPAIGLEQPASGSPTIMETTMSASRMSHAPGANSPPTKGGLDSLARLPSLTPRTAR